MDTWCSISKRLLFNAEAFLGQQAGISGVETASRSRVRSSRSHQVRRRRSRGHISGCATRVPTSRLGRRDLFLRTARRSVRSTDEDALKDRGRARKAEGFV